MTLFRVEVVRPLHGREKKRAGISYLVLADTPENARNAVRVYDADVNNGKFPDNVGVPMEMGDEPIAWNYYSVA